MARLLVFADRAPGDVEWKGDLVWSTILSLAEAHHEVLAVTPIDLNLLEGISHPRLNLARPAPSFAARFLGRWLRAVLQFQPEIVHSFSLRSDSAVQPGSGLMAGLIDRISAWPALVQALNAFPRVQRWSTVFDERDFAPFPTVRAPLELEGVLKGRRTDSLKLAPQSDGSLEEPTQTRCPDLPFPDFIVVPAPVSEWARPQVDLLMLADFLENNSEVGACIVGGWGDFGLRERRDGWESLGSLSARVHLLPELDLLGLSSVARQSRGIWLRALAPSAWRTLVSFQLAELLALPIHGSPSRPLPSGSSANFLSRLYSNN